MTVLVETCRAIWHACPETARADLSVSTVEAAVSRALGDGWNPDALLEYATRGIDTDKLPAASVHRRLKTLPTPDEVEAARRRTSTPLPPAFEDLAFDHERAHAVPPTPEYLAAKARYFGGAR